MRTVRNILALTFATALSFSVRAEDGGPASNVAQGAFFLLEGGAAFREGEAKTRNGGAPWGGGGKMHSLKFEQADLIRAKLGYRWTGLDAFLSYDRISGDVEWQVDFPAILQQGIPFSGEAVSQVILFNVGIRHEVTPGTTVVASAGIGASFNSIESATEGLPVYAWPGSDRDASFAARASLGLTHNFTDYVAVALNSTFDYYGRFRTSDERQFGPVTEPIVPYEFEAWGGTVSAGLSLNF